MNFFYEINIIILFSYLTCSLAILLLHGIQKRNLIVRKNMKKLRTLLLTEFQRNYLLPRLPSSEFAVRNSLIPKLINFPGAGLRIRSNLGTLSWTRFVKDSDPDCTGTGFLSSLYRILIQFVHESDLVWTIFLSSLYRILIQFVQDSDPVCTEFLSSLYRNHDPVCTVF